MFSKPLILGLCMATTLTQAIDIATETEVDQRGSGGRGGGRGGGGRGGGRGNR